MYNKLLEYDVSARVPTTKTR